MRRVTPRRNPADYSNDELRSLTQTATEAALYTLLPYFSEGEPSQTLGRADYEMLITAINLIVMRRVGRPITA